MPLNLTWKSKDENGNAFDGVWCFEDESGNRYYCGREVGTKAQAIAHIEASLVPPPETYQQRRRRRYNELGCTDAAVNEAIKQLILDGDRTQIDALNATRALVKTEIPKE
ncbi:MAG: hypothetical protein JNL32_00175 [Candidatus Kapabacteria bacterium]|nr:hypothetical protein [Candidatus Kapabacteria bacterium]